MNDVLSTTRIFEVSKGLLNLISASRIYGASNVQ